MKIIKIVAEFVKPSQFAQELKSNLMPNIHDTLMHHLDTSRSTFTDGFIFANPVKLH